MTGKHPGIIEKDSILFEFLINTVIEDTVKIAEVLMEDRKDAKDRKFIDVVLETCLDEKSKKGDVLVYLMGGFHNSAISRSNIW